jgi:hypothetical protein
MPLLDERGFLHHTQRQGQVLVRQTLQHQPALLAERIPDAGDPFAGVAGHRKLASRSAGLTLDVACHLEPREHVAHGR